MYVNQRVRLPSQREVQLKRNQQAKNETCAWSRTTQYFRRYTSTRQLVFRAKVKCSSKEITRPDMKLKQRRVGHTLALSTCIGMTRARCRSHVPKFTRLRWKFHSRLGLEMQGISGSGYRRSHIAIIIKNFLSMTENKLKVVVISIANFFKSLLGTRCYNSSIR